jgi:hypothetical protein
MDARHVEVSPTLFLKPSFALTVRAGHGLQVLVQAQPPVERPVLTLVRAAPQA